MLDSIRLQNFKTHRDTEIKLGRLTVLVGPNGAGKSSVLQAIQLVPGVRNRARIVDASESSLWKPMTTIARHAEQIGKCLLHFGGTFADGSS